MVGLSDHNSHFKSWFLISWQKGRECKEKFEVSHQSFEGHDIERSPLLHSGGDSFCFVEGKTRGLTHGVAAEQ